MALRKQTDVNHGQGQTDHDRRWFIKKTSVLGAVMAGSALGGSVKAEGGGTVIAEKENQLPLLDSQFIYLNSGTEGVMSAPVMENLQDNFAEWISHPTEAYETDPKLGKHQYQNRSDIERLLGVEKNNICLTDNTTMGLNMVIMGLAFQPGDKVVTTNHEHNAMLSPLAVQQEKLGLTIQTRSFPSSDSLRHLTVDQLLDALFPNTAALRGAKALCVSHVYPGTGVRIPLEALRKKTDELNIRYLIVDGAQAFGAVDLTQPAERLSHADFYACGGHKWLNGPPGTGILYIKNAEIRPPEFYPTVSQRMLKYGDNAMEGNNQFPMAEALQVRGCSNAPGFSAMVYALQLAQKKGSTLAIEKKILAFSARVRTFVSGRAPNALVSPGSEKQPASGLTVFFPFRWQAPETQFSDQKTADFVVAELLKKNIRIRSIGFDDGASSGQKSYALRVSTAVFNTHEQLDQFQTELVAILRRL